MRRAAVIVSMAAAMVGALGGLVSAGRADWTLTSADFKEESKITVNEFSLKGGASVSTGAGQLRKIETKNLMMLAAERKAGEPSSPWVARLRNGDVLYGMPGDSDENTLTFTLTEGVDVAVALKNVATLAQRTQAPAAASATRDLLLTTNKDTVQGDFLGIKGGQVVMQVNTAQRKIDLTGTAGVTFGGVTPVRSVPELSARLTFAGGTVMAVKDVSWRLNEVTFSDSTGVQRRTKADQLLSVEVLGGRVVSLTELDPQKDEQVSTFASKWPMQINKNVLGQPLRVGKQTYSRGIGVHVTSSLVYELDGSFETLTLQAGVDDSAAPFGEANLAILLDGKTLWEKKGVKAGQLSEVLKLPIKGGRKLELLATPAQRLDVQGRVNWINIALVR